MKTERKVWRVAKHLFRKAHDNEERTVRRKKTNAAGKLRELKQWQKFNLGFSALSYRYICAYLYCHTPCTRVLLKLPFSVLRFIHGSWPKNRAHIQWNEFKNMMKAKRFLVNDGVMTVEGRRANASEGISARAAFFAETECQQEVRFERDEWEIAHSFSKKLVRCQTLSPNRELWSSSTIFHLSACVPRIEKYNSANGTSPLEVSEYILINAAAVKGTNEKRETCMRWHSVSWTQFQLPSDLGTSGVHCDRFSFFVNWLQSCGFRRPPALTKNQFNQNKKLGINIWIQWRWLSLIRLISDPLLILKGFCWKMHSFRSVLYYYFFLEIGLMIP